MSITDYKVHVGRECRTITEATVELPVFDAGSNKELSGAQRLAEEKISEFAQINGYDWNYSWPPRVKKDADHYVITWTGTVELD